MMVEAIGIVLLVVGLAIVLSVITAMFGLVGLGIWVILGMVGLILAGLGAAGFLGFLEPFNKYIVDAIEYLWPFGDVPQQAVVLFGP